MICHYLLRHLQPLPLGTLSQDHHLFSLTFLIPTSNLKSLFSTLFQTVFFKGTVVAHTRDRGHGFGNKVLLCCFLFATYEFCQLLILRTGWFFK